MMESIGSKHWSAGEEGGLKLESLWNLEAQQIEHGGSYIGNARVFQIFPKCHAIYQSRPAESNWNLQALAALSK